MSLEGAHLHSIQYRYTWEGTAKLKETIDALRHQDLSQPCQPEPGVAGRKLSDRPAQQPSSISAAGIAERKEKSLGLLAMSGHVMPGSIVQLSLWENLQKQLALYHPDINVPASTLHHEQFHHHQTSPMVISMSCLTCLDEVRISVGESLRCDGNYT